MSVRAFAQEIEYLLLIGALRGRAILELHWALKGYELGVITDEEMQEAIAKYHPEPSLTDMINEDEPPQRSP